MPGGWGLWGGGRLGWAGGGLGGCACAVSPRAACGGGGANDVAVLPIDTGTMRLSYAKKALFAAAPGEGGTVALPPVPAGGAVGDETRAPHPSHLLLSPPLLPPSPEGGFRGEASSGGEAA